MSGDEVRAEIERFDSQPDSKLRCTWIGRRTLKVCGKKCRPGKLTVLAEHDRRCYTHAQVRTTPNLLTVTKQRSEAQPEKPPEALLRVMLRSEEASVFATAKTTEEKVEAAFALEALLSGWSFLATTHQEALLTPALASSLLKHNAKKPEPELPCSDKQWEKSEERSLEEEFRTKLTLVRLFLLHPVFVRSPKFAPLFKERFGLETASQGSKPEEETKQ